MDELNSFAKDKSLYHGVDEPDGFVVKLLVKGEYGILEKTHGKEARVRDSLVQLLRVSSSGEQGSLHHPQRGAGSKSRVCLRHNLFGRGPGHKYLAGNSQGKGGQSQRLPGAPQLGVQLIRGAGQPPGHSSATASTTPGSIPARRGT